MSAGADPVTLPTGTVTFMFTDIEGSTGLLQRLGDGEYTQVLEAHHDLVRTSIAAASGFEVTSEGDAFFAVFIDPLSAIEAAISVQRGLDAPTWAHEAIKVRVGVHTGNGVLGGDDYIGVDVHRASRISDSGNGGQIVISEVTARLLQGRLPAGTTIERLGRFRLAGFAEPTTLYQLGAEGLQSDFPPLRAPMAESRLPVPLTEFVGRRDEVTTGLEILGDHRALTLTGPGGTGKTRLALEIARRAEERFADGAYFVALASLTTPDLIPMTIIDSLGLRTAGGVDPIEHLSRYLSEREVLLILDNFEQILDGASLVTSLLGRAPDLSILVTSRSPLRISGERELPVPPLDVPASSLDVDAARDTDGVRLFASRAEAVRPDFTLTNDNIGTVVAIIRSLDGLPLAIELAASRMRSLTPDLILERLGNQLLASRSTDLPARQQTIVDAIGWSYDLLDASRQGLFEQLSVFSGTFALTEAERVCPDQGDVLEDLAELVDSSLIRQTATSGEPRYRMLTVIKEFAYAALVAGGEDRRMLDRHAAVFADLAETADREILTSLQQHWLERLTLDHDNMRSAFDHCIAVDDSETALRLAGSLWRFWQIRGHIREGIERIERALDIAGETHPLERARAFTGLGGLLYWKGDWEAVLEPYEAALALFREHGSEEDLADALYNMSFPVGYRGDLDKARDLLGESLKVSERIGKGIGVGRAEWGLANMAVYDERWSKAVDALKRAVDEFAKIDAPFDLGWAWFMLAHAWVRMGQVEAAREPERKALEIFSSVGDVSALALICEMVGVISLKLGLDTEAAFISGAAQRVKVDTGIALGDVELNRYPEMDEFLAEMNDAARASFEEGYNTSLEDVIERARAVLS